MAVYPVSQPRSLVKFPEWPFGLNKSSGILKNIVSYLPLSANAGGVDLAGGFHGTLVAGPVMGGTVLGSALFLDNTDDHVSLANPTGLAFAAPASVSFWFRGTTDDFNTAFSVSSSAATGNSFWIAVGNGTSGTLTNELITLSRTIAGVTTFTIGYTTATRTEMFDGKPHHVAVVSNGSAWSIYLDGQSRTVTTGSGTNDGTFSNVASVDNALVGALNNGGLGLRLFLAGNIWHVGVWNRALSAGEVATLFRARSEHLAVPPGTLYFNVGAGPTGRIFTLTGGGGGLASRSRGLAASEMGGY